MSQIPVPSFLDAAKEIAAEKPAYRKGGSGFDGTCDCIGLIIGAIRRCGGKWPGIHGSNWAARNAVTCLNRLVSARDLSPGDLVFKSRAPRESGYSLPARYASGPDRNDYYHVGIVLSAAPLRILHMTTPTVQTVTKPGSWSHYGRCKLVGPAPQSGPEAEKKSAPAAKDRGALSQKDIARLHTMLSAIEQQLDAIYGLTGGRG